jgi:hypothetical protein
MDESSYLQCANGCLAYVHVGCAKSAPHWSCCTCRAKPKEAALSSPNLEDGFKSEGSESGEEKTIESMEFENL